MCHLMGKENVEICLLINQILEKKYLNFVKFV